MIGQFHTTVLLKESIDFLKVKRGNRYIDATLGGGGHTKAILDKGGIVLGIDTDQEALDFVKESLKFEIQSLKLTLARGNFRDIDKIAHLNNFKNVSGIIFDLGVSSHQINCAKRGFSFLRSGPLDMRMDKTSSIRAMDLVNVLQKGDLYEIFSKLGQERRSRSISDYIVKSRKVRAIKTTDELVDLIRQALRIKKKKLSLFERTLISQKVFQALRIAVNNELENLKIALPKALELLGSKGRLLVISFHSLEDGIVKRTFAQFEKDNKGRIITKKVIFPKMEEIIKNKRAKSAKLRVFEKN
ncbi:MAG: 16S rRNA (cytosine(1402)-N(4))-methyltransferase [Candidatus Levybacteria bacterium RBG_16_35_11]|nr:MAG: 16S rRNA (cytosine(1402)-N(4))-methyltransferase [Candidatus Levybacteria bacterium RBG_16_35_11]